MSLLQQQAAAFQQKHRIAETASRKLPASIVWDKEEAKGQDIATLSALAHRALKDATKLEPELANYSDLLDGLGKDRELLTKEEHNKLNKRLRRLFLLLSPHLQARSAQELFDIAIRCLRADKHNVDDVLAAAFPHHDSPFFTKLVQVIHVKSNPTWSWLQKFREKPATLLRPAIAKYCAKETSLLMTIGDVVIEYSKMQKQNQPLATFFLSLWLEVLSNASIVGPEIVGVALPAVQHALRKPHLSTFFHAALVVVVALNAKADLTEEIRAKLMEQIARQVNGDQHQHSIAALGLMLQLQASRRSLTEARATLSGLPLDVDSRNELSASLDQSTNKPEKGGEDEKAMEDVSDGSANSHPLFRKCVEGGESDLATLAKEVDDVTALMLCASVQELSGRGASVSKFVIGELSGRQAMAALLAEALPKLFPTQGSGAGQLELLAACTKACQGLAWTDTFAKVDQAAYTETLKSLLAATTATAKTIEKTDETTNGLVSATATLFEICLTRPMLLSDELQEVLTLTQTILFPALLRVATGFAVPRHGLSLGSAAAANGLMLLGSFVSAGKSGWGMDATIVPVLMCQIVCSAAKEVRMAAMDLLGVVSACKHASTKKTLSKCPCAEALRTAGLLRSTSEVMPATSWESVAEKKLAKEASATLPTLIQEIIRRREDVLQDRSFAAALLGRFLRGKLGDLDDAALKSACSFWTTSLATLAPCASPGASILLQQVPTETLVSSMQTLLPTIVTELLQSLGKSEDQQEVCQLLRLVLLRVASAPEGKQEVFAPFAQDVLIAFANGLAEKFEQQVPHIGEAAKWSQPLCSCLASTRKQSLPDDLHTEIAQSLFRLSVAARSAAASRQVNEETEDVTAIQMGIVANHASTAFIEIGADADLLMTLLKKFPALKNKQLSTAPGYAASELLCHGITSCKSGFSSRPQLLQACMKSTSEAAAQVSKQSGAAAMPDKHAVLQLLQAVAAICEDLVQSGKFEGSLEVSKKVCSQVSEVCTALGANMTPSVLSAVVRSCSSLSAMLPAIDNEADTDIPAPLQTVVDSLGSYGNKVPTEVAAMLTASFPRLWSSPTLKLEDALLKERVLQQRLRLLLFSSSQVAPVDSESQGNPEATMVKMVKGTNVDAALDFGLLLLILRRLEENPNQKKNKKNKKRRAPEVEEAEALLEDVKEVTAERIIDEATKLLQQFGTHWRYHACANLLQTLLALAAAAANGGEVPLCLGLNLLPPGLFEQVSKHASTILAIGLRIVAQFFEEHGLPMALDAVDFENSESRQTLPDETSLSIGASGGGDADEMEEGGPTDVLAARAITHSAWLACALESYLSQQGEEFKDCQNAAVELRSLLWRSLAVHHPDALLRSVCLSMQVENASPAIASGDLMADSDFVTSTTVGAMGASASALRERAEVLMQDDATAGEEPTNSAFLPLVMKHVIKNVLAPDAGAPVASQVVAWQLLSTLCNFASKKAAKAILKTCVPAIVECLSNFVAQEKPKKKELPVLEACCSCLQTAIKQLGKGLLEKLNALAPPLLMLASSASKAAGESGGAIATVSEPIFEVLTSLVSAMGSFLSPFLERVVGLITDDSRSWKSSSVEKFAREVVAKVPSRLLLPAIEKSIGNGELADDSITDDAARNQDLQRFQRLACMLAWLFANATQDFVGTATTTFMKCYLRLVAVGPKLVSGFLEAEQAAAEVPDSLYKFQRDESDVKMESSSELVWEERCCDGSLRHLNALASVAFSEFALRLNLDQLRPCFTQLVDWSRKGQVTILGQHVKSKEKDSSLFLQDAIGPSSWIAALTTMQALSAIAPGLAEDLLVPTCMKDLASSMTAARKCGLRLAAQHRASGTKKRRGKSNDEEPVSILLSRAGNEVLHNNSWWWLDVAISTLSFIATGLAPRDRQGEELIEGALASEVYENLVDPFVDLMDLCEFLPASNAATASKSFDEALQTASVALAALGDGPKVKQFFSAMLSKTRSRDVEVRLQAVRCCHKVWTTLGVQVISSLSEVVEYARELFEDEDTRVEDAVRSLIKTVEGCTSENLQDALK